MKSSSQRFVLQRVTANSKNFRTTNTNHILKNQLQSFSSCSATAFASRSPLLFTPGPLTTSARVKQRMLEDVGSRDETGFLQVMHDVRKKLVHAANTTQETHDCVLIQGAGTFAVESVLGSVLGGTGDQAPRVLILNNGAYGVRQKQILDIYGIKYESLDYEDYQAISLSDLAETLKKAGGEGKQFTHVSMVHHETTGGVLNPLTEVCSLLQNEFQADDISLLVDSMSAFGAYEVDMSPNGKHSSVKFMVSSANKCIEGVPGFSFAIYEKKSLEKLKSIPPKSLALDLYGQAAGLCKKGGQFRFTPPTSSILAFHEAMIEWENEGGQKARLARYEASYEVLKKGIEEVFGLEFYVSENDRGAIIHTIIAPNHPNWNFETFYNYLSERGFVIYPGKLSKAESFRLGTIGKIYPKDCENLLLVMERCFKEMGIPLKG